MFIINPKIKWQILQKLSIDNKMVDQFKLCHIDRTFYNRLYFIVEVAQAAHRCTN